MNSLYPKKVFSERVKLQDICRLITDGKHGDCRDEEGSGYYFLSAKDVRGGKLIYGDARQITKEDFEDTHRRTRLKPLDILMVSTGATIGRMAIADDIDQTERTTFQKSVALLKPDQTKVNPYWLYYNLHYAMRELINFTAGSAQKNLLLKDLRAFQISLPSLEIQKEIASTLKAYDDLIANNERRIGLLEEAIRGLYREWFVRLRFPGWEETAVVDGVPEGWGKTTINNVFSILGGGTPSKAQPEYWSDGEINWYTPSDLTKSGQMFMEASSEKINSSGLSKSSARLFPPYSVMMTSRATIGATSINTTEACTNQGFITCIPNERITIYFLYCWIKANVPEFLSLATGTTFKEISKGVFNRIVFVLPDVQLVRTFEATVEPMGKQILNLQRQNEKLKEARDSLLPRLMSGRIVV